MKVSYEKEAASEDKAKRSQSTELNKGIQKQKL